MWGGLYPLETERALTERAANPRPILDSEPSLWSTAGALIGAPLAGAAQGVNESMRLLSRLATARPEVDPPERREQVGGFSLRSPEVQAQLDAERAKSRERTAEMRADADALFRGAVEYWKPDPQTAGFAQTLLHEAGRIITKAVGYGSAGGPVGMIAGTSVDEGATGYLSLRDRGVDPATAAQAGLVRGAVAAASMVAPAIGSTVARTVGIVASTGPGLFVGEQLASRAILERAGYWDIAAEFDPWDPAGLAVSLVPGAVVAGALHRGRARRAAAALPPEQVGPEAALQQAADTPAVVEAAHVQFGQDVVDASMLGNRADPAARVAHAQALERARQALDDGRPLELGDIPVDPVRAERVRLEVSGRLVDLQRLPPELRPDDVAGQAEPLTMPAPIRAGGDEVIDLQGLRAGNLAADVPGQPMQASPAAEAQLRAQRIATENPGLRARMEDDGRPAVAAADLLLAERQAGAREAQETKTMFEAAVECLISRGIE
jgi:hypothetical protein